MENGWIQVTSRCNLNCSYCYMNANSVKKDINLSEYKDILCKFKSLDISTIMISGGEPTIHHQIVDFIEEAKKSGFKVGLVTNGVYLSEELLSCIKKNDVCVQVSLDAINKNKAIIAGGIDKTESIIENIGKMICSNTNICLSSTFIDQTISEVKEVIEFALHMGIYTVHFCFLIPSKRCQDNNVRMTNLLQTMKYLYNVQIKEYMRIQIDCIENIVCSIIFQDCYPYYCNCMAGKNIEVSYNGSLLQCGALLEESELLKEQKINIYSDVDEIKEYLKTWRKVSVEDIAECQKCDAKYVCRGGCRAIAYRTHGNIRGRLPFCDEMKELVDIIKNDYRMGKIDAYVKFLQEMKRNNLLSDIRLF